MASGDSYLNYQRSLFITSNDERLTGLTVSYSWVEYFEIFRLTPCDNQIFPPGYSNWSSSIIYFSLSDNPIFPLIYTTWFSAMVYFFSLRWSTFSSKIFKLTIFYKAQQLWVVTFFHTLYSLTGKLNFWFLTAFFMIQTKTTYPIKKSIILKIFKKISWVFGDCWFDVAR